MHSLFQLDIPKRSLNCSKQGERLQAGMEIYSLILEEEDKRFIRRDFCSACWALLQTEGEMQPHRSYWKSKIESKKSSIKGSRTEQALNLLRNLLQAESACKEEIFVLCLFLAHARQLALRQEWVEEGISFQLYEVLGHDEFLTIQGVKLSQLQIDSIQQSLATKLRQP